MTPRGRPPTGFAHYLRDMVFGALDGVITTMAVVAGVSGADLGGRVALILGVANLVGDGISMGAATTWASSPSSSRPAETCAGKRPGATVWPPSRPS
jgi:hypothetical protein